MAGIKYFPDNLDIKNKTIILRLDLNVPLKNKNIQDFTRINVIIPFLKSLIMKEAKIIIITHLGRPEGTRNSEFSLIPKTKIIEFKKFNQRPKQSFSLQANFRSAYDAIEFKCPEGHIIRIDTGSQVRGDIKSENLGNHYKKEILKCGKIDFKGPFEELELEIIPIHEITRYPFKKFNLIFILCEPINPKKIKLKEHLRFNWVQSDELLDYNFIEGDIKFIKSF